MNAFQHLLQTTGPNGRVFASSPYSSRGNILQPWLQNDISTLAALIGSPLRTPQATSSTTTTPATQAAPPSQRTKPVLIDLAEEDTPTKPEKNGKRNGHASTSHKKRKRDSKGSEQPQTKKQRTLRLSGSQNAPVLLDDDDDSDNDDSDDDDSDDDDITIQKVHSDTPGSTTLSLPSKRSREEQESSKVRSNGKEAGELIIPRTVVAFEDGDGLHFDLTQPKPQKIRKLDSFPDKKDPSITQTNSAEPRISNLDIDIPIPIVPVKPDIADVKTPIKEDVHRTIDPDQPEQSSVAIAVNAAISTDEAVSDAAADISAYQDDLDRLLLPTTQLLPYQRVGIKWMISQEKGPLKGGILADDMGLGKTLQALVTVALNKMSARDRENASEYVGGTLVLVPQAVLMQWTRQITRHFKPRVLSYLVYYGPNRPRDFKEITPYDVVISTYGILTAEHRRERRTLIRVRWHRIILDEAHLIKNRDTRSHRAASALKGVYRWALTGTPVQNTLNDLLSLLVFIRRVDANIPGQLQDWKLSIDGKCNSPNPEIKKEGFERLRKFLSHVMKRRTKQTKWNGKLILKLPPVTYEEISVQMDEMETAFYMSLQQSFQDVFNSMMKKGRKYVMKAYLYLLELLLRLRQTADHCYLVLLCNRVEYGSRKFNWRTVIKPVERHFEKMAKELMEGRASSDMAKIIRNLGGTGAMCSLCSLDLSPNRTTTPCGHTFCSACLEQWLERQNFCPQCNLVLEEQPTNKAPPQDQKVKDKKKLVPLPRLTFDDESSDSESTTVRDDFPIPQLVKPEKPKIKQQISQPGSKGDGIITLYLDDDDDDSLPIPSLPVKSEHENELSIPIPKLAVKSERNRGKCPKQEKDLSLDDLPSLDSILDSDPFALNPQEKALQKTTKKENVKAEKKPKGMKTRAKRKAEKKKKHSVKTEKECTEKKPAIACEGTEELTKAKVKTEKIKSETQNPVKEKERVKSDEVQVTILKQEPTQTVSNSTTQNSNQNSNQDVIACICNGGDDGRLLIQCDTCLVWYHADCVDITDEEAEEMPTYMCKQCQTVEIENARRRRKLLKNPKKIDLADLRSVMDGILQPTRDLLKSGVGVDAVESEASLRMAASADFRAGSKIESMLTKLNQVLEKYPSDKCVIFSQFTMFLDLIESHLEKEGIAYTRIDGSMTMNARQVALETFEDEADHHVMIVSTRAGGLGLCLTVANHVFLLDPWWNPAVDQQAIDRVCRLGQEKDVHIYRFITKGTIEEAIRELQESKQILADNALSKEGLPVQFHRLSIEELRSLFSVRRPKPPSDDSGDGINSTTSTTSPNSTTSATSSNSTTSTSPSSTTTSTTSTNSTTSTSPSSTTAPKPPPS